MDERRERLAALAHEQWSGWIEYMFGRCVRHADGSITIPPTLAARWTRQSTTPYAELPEHERESDRVEADKVLSALGLLQ